MTTRTRHFVLTPDGGINEFTAEAAAKIAMGTTPLPQFADRELRYLQVTLDDEADNEIRVQTAGARIRFDGEGRLIKAGPTSEDTQISHFEHDAVVQWSLRDLPAVAPTFH